MPNKEKICCKNCLNKSEETLRNHMLSCLENQPYAKSILKYTKVSKTLYSIRNTL